MLFQWVGLLIIRIQAYNNPLVPFQIQSYHRFYNVIGNVLGTSGQNTSYLDNGDFRTATFTPLA